MGCDLDKRQTEPRLHLVEGDGALASVGQAAAPSLSAAPFRPGELPLTSWVPLDPATRRLLGRRASEAALPTELYARIAVEASRLTSEISLLTSRPRSEVVIELDVAASAPTATATATATAHTLATSELRRYAVELRKSHPVADAGEVLALRLPEEISGAWNAAASAARLEMPRWIAGALDEAPDECVTWESAAAASCRSLGEWAYASWLRASASARA